MHSCWRLGYGDAVAIDVGVRLLWLLHGDGGSVMRIGVCSVERLVFSSKRVLGEHGFVLLLVHAAVVCSERWVGVAGCWIVSWRCLVGALVLGSTIPLSHGVDGGGVWRDRLGVMSLGHSTGGEERQTVRER